jgi:transposase-like protein
MVSLSLPHFHFDIISNFSAFCDSTFMITLQQLRKVTKSKSVFPTDDSLLKMLYLAMIDITKKWTGKRRDWGIIHSQLEVFFADRLDR